MKIFIEVNSCELLVMIFLFDEKLVEDYTILNIVDYLIVLKFGIERSTVVFTEGLNVRNSSCICMVSYC